MSKSKISFMNHDRHVHIHIFRHSPFSSVYIVQSSFNKRAIEWLHCECMTKMKSLPRLPCNSNIYIYRSPGRIAIRMCEQQTGSQMTKKYEWTKSRAFFFLFVFVCHRRRCRLSSRCFFFAGSAEFVCVHCIVSCEWQEERKRKKSEWSMVVNKIAHKIVTNVCGSVIVDLTTADRIL